MIKGGLHLETLGRARAMAFDKTGTLTTGHPKLVELAPVAGVDDVTLLKISASAEALSQHPIAQAVLAGVNPFDQWGVELGKEMANALLPGLEGGAAPENLDPSTAAWLRQLRT